MLDVRKLRLLRELAHRETIAAVAEALSYTPSAVSQQLAALEREAGVPLLRRTGRRVVLTPAGAALAERTEQILALLEQASGALAATRAGLAGPLRIGAFPTAVRTILPAALVALGRDHPDLELMVTELDPAAVPAALRSGAVDVALIHDYDYVPAEPDPALDTEPLLEEAIYLASSGAAGAAGAAEPGRDPVWGCRDAPWIVGSPDTLCHAMAVRACQAAGFTPRIRHHADDFATVLALVAAGQGVALVPQLGATGATGSPQGVVLTPLPTRRRTRIAYRNGTRDQPPVAACAAAIRASARALGLDVPGPG
ncbi:MAG TPA: LysR substrate-binding domain-containing protein [Streptosporangiaceae bacterium]|jgi:DNA-binding transcriptional LysR family regulator|nr:LysR substrate-binding domain-containing protein [Streptosporangiaceae bacterium]